MLIIGNFMLIINIFSLIYKKLFTVQKQKSAFRKASLMGFSKSTKVYI